ncbi:MAG: hypothetical protein ACJ76U_11585 [Gaiellaceae bacterium]|jgi:hypothetical protein
MQLEDDGARPRFLVLDRAGKFTREFDEVFRSGRLCDQSIGRGAEGAGACRALGRSVRTRRRGIYRAGSTYVVLVVDEDRVNRPKVATSLAEALELRETLKATRRRRGDPHDRHDPSSPGWGSGTGAA